MPLSDDLTIWDTLGLVLPTAGRRWPERKDDVDESILPPGDPLYRVVVDLVATALSAKVDFSLTLQSCSRPDSEPVTLTFNAPILDSTTFCVHWGSDVQTFDKPEPAAKRFLELVRGPQWKPNGSNS